MSASSRHLLITTTAFRTIKRLVMPQVPYLLEAGWKLTLVSSEAIPSGYPGVSSLGIPMARSVDPLADAKALALWRRLLVETRPDVVHASTPKAGLLAMVAAKNVGIPHRVFLHRGARWETESGWRRRLLMHTDRVTMRAANHVLAVSNSLADLVYAEGLVRQRPTVLGSGGSKGVNLAQFRPPVATPSGPPTVGFLGRLSADKGLNEVLDAFRAIRVSNPDAVLLVGGGVDDEQPPTADTLWHLHNTPGVQILGPIERSPEFLGRLDLLVFPSKREGLPNVVIEAAACGVPTVAWDATGVRDSIKKGVTGDLAPLGDVDALRAAAVAWLQSSHTTRVECRRWAEEFDEVRLARLWVDYLDEACPI